MKLALRDEIRGLESELIRDGGFPSQALMESAGRAAAQSILARYLTPSRCVRVICGGGNNGGDGFVIARWLSESGCTVRVQLVGLAAELAGDPATYARLWQWCGGTIDEIPTGELPPALAGELQLDALFGTGLDRPVQGAYALAIDAINRSGREGAAVLAIDVPSGLDADRGVPMGSAVQARATLTFGLGKPGLYVTPGMEYAGAVEVFDIGIPAASVARWARTATLVEAGDPMLALAPRPPVSHKGTFGHVMVFGGSESTPGAAELACRGALRAGAGLVTLCAPAGGAPVEWPEIMRAPVTAFRAEEWRDEWLERKTALVFGPGMGRNHGVRDFLARAAGASVPLVVDADGLNVLADEPGLLAARRAATVLTPHPAEAGRLLGIDGAAVQADRIRAAREIAEKYRAVVILKGARSVIALPEGTFYINASGSPALAAGGTGDVLAGVAGALLASGMGAAKAACMAAYVHGRAAERPGFAAGGLRASDLADGIPAELDKLVTR